MLRRLYKVHLFFPAWNLCSEISINRWKCYRCAQWSWLGHIFCASQLRATKSCSSLSSLTHTAPKASRFPANCNSYRCVIRQIFVPLDAHGCKRINYGSPSENMAGGCLWAWLECVLHSVTLSFGCWEVPTRVLKSCILCFTSSAKVVFVLQELM